MEELTNDGTNDPTKSTRIRDFPRGFTPSGNGTGSQFPVGTDATPVDVGDSGISTSGTTGNASLDGRPSPDDNGLGTNNRRNSRRKGFTTTGVSDPAGDNPSDATPTEPTIRIRTDNAYNGPSTEEQIRPVSSGLIERSLTRSLPSDSYPQSGIQSLLDIDSSVINLPEQAYVEKTKMAMREESSLQDIPDTAEYEDDWTITPPKPQMITSSQTGSTSKNKKNKNAEKSQPQPSTGSNQTIVSFKFDKATTEQLTELFVWAYDAMDKLSFFGLGVDTETIPIWAITEKQAGARVRILERRAARSQHIREVVVPKLLDSRDYIEVAIEDGPKIIEVIREVITNGGIKPSFNAKRNTDVPE